MRNGAQETRQKPNRTRQTKCVRAYWLNDKRIKTSKANTVRVKFALLVGQCSGSHLHYITIVFSNVRRQSLFPQVFCALIK